MIFVKSVQRCIALCQLLVDQNFPAIGIHRAMMQEERWVFTDCKIWKHTAGRYSKVLECPMVPRTYKVPYFCKFLQHFSVWWPHIERKEVMFCCHTKHYETQRNRQCHAHFFCQFYYEMAFPSKQPMDVLLYSTCSIMRWLWNKPSFHICLDNRMENNLKMSTFCSTESPSRAWANSGIPPKSCC